jgi:hypothetical protein
MKFKKNNPEHLCALTSLAAVTLNNATQQWIENRTIPFTWVVKVVKAA